MKEHLINLVQTPHSFFLYPFGKFLIESISFLLHLMLISYVAVYKIGDFNQGATLSRLEVLAWLSCLSFTLREGEEIYADGLAAYLKYGRNILDLTLHSMVVVLFSLRFCGLVLFDLDYGLVFLFDLLFTLYIIGLWARLSIIMLAHPRAGPLIRAIFQMGTDIRNFLYIASLFLAGFSIAFYYLVNVSAESLGVTIQGYVLCGMWCVVCVMWLSMCACISVSVRVRMSVNGGHECLVYREVAAFCISVYM